MLSAVFSQLYKFHFTVLVKSHFFLSRKDSGGLLYVDPTCLKINMSFDVIATFFSGYVLSAWCAKAVEGGIGHVILSTEMIGHSCHDVGAG